MDKKKGNQVRDWPKSENDIVTPETTEEETPVEVPVEEVPTPPTSTVINELNNGNGVQRV